MKFSEMAYQRPDLTQIRLKYEEITAGFSKSVTAGGQYELILEHEKLQNAFQTMATLTYIRLSVNTEDAFYEAEQAFFDENTPLVENYALGFYKAVAASPLRGELAEKTGETFLSNIDLMIRSNSPKVLELKKKENALVTQYEKLLAGAKIDFDGQVLNLSQIQKYQISQQRDIRKSAWEKTAGFFISQSKQLDELFDALVKNRTEQAKILGYENYVQLGYDRLGRNCYGPAEVRAYREQIARDLVPMISEIKKKQAERLGLPDLKFYDDSVLFSDGNPAPKGDRPALVAQASKMYHEMGDLTGEFFDFMTRNELLDLDSKKGKAVGGYCTEIPLYGAPFIFANFNGTAGDVEVLTHEAGHALAGYVARDMALMENRCPTMEAAETHSMSMELFSRPWDALFFGESQTAKFHQYQLETALDFIPYGCLVDEFQTVIYENPGFSAAERKQTWKNLEKKYRPWIDFDRLPFFSDGGGYQRQHHIYSFPLYYIDYCLAQTTALQFWSLSQKGWKSAFERYLTFVRAGGSKTYVELVEIAGLTLPFQEGCIKKLSREIGDFLYGSGGNA